MPATSRGTGRHVVVFGALVAAGLVIWVLSTPSVAGSLFGEAAHEAAFSSPFYGFLGLPLIALPPLAAGFVLPKGFFVWGVATVLAYPPGMVWTYLNAGPEAAFPSRDPAMSQIVGFAFVDLIILFVLAFFCTVASGLGAAARCRMRWRRGRLGQSPLGAG